MWDRVTTKMLGQRKPHGLSLTLANVMNDVVSGTAPRGHPEIMRHHEGFDFVSGNRSLSAVEVSLVNVMSRETVLRQYVDSVKQDYDYVLLDCRPSLGMLVINDLSALDYVLVPVQADYLAADSGDLTGAVWPRMAYYLSLRYLKRHILDSFSIGTL